MIHASSTYRAVTNCVKISNGSAEVIVSTEFGPRILSYSLAGGENILGWHPEAKVQTALGEWRPYGGHRLWAAPENMPRSYAPDSAPVEYFVKSDLSVRFMPPPETSTGLQKQITVSLSKEGSGAVLEHRITNIGENEIELSAWALTIMRDGGEAVIPGEPWQPYSPEHLLPVRSLALWSYTDFTDPRWRFSKDSIRLRCDSAYPNQQKIGVLNRQGWAGYEWEDLKFVKRFDFVEGAEYPDFNSNTEVYTAGSFMELESLSPLTKLAQGEFVVYVERWELLSRSEIDLEM
jgi:hypothetical protein